MSISHQCVHAQDEVHLLKQSNIELIQQLASSDVLGPHPRSPLRQMPIPSQPAALKGSAKGTALPASPSQLKPPGQQNSFAEGQAKAAGQDGPAAGEVELKCDMGQGEMRLQVSHRSVKHRPHSIPGPGCRDCVHLGMPCCPAGIPMPCRMMQGLVLWCCTAGTQEAAEAQCSTV